MPTLKIEIPIEPMGKARPRVVTRYGQSIAYTPKKTKVAEKIIALNARDAMLAQNFNRIPSGTPITALIDAYYGIPKSATKKFKEKCLDGSIMPTKKPDADNIAKLVLDALNGIAFDDDSQVTELIVRKHYESEGKIIAFLSF